MTVSAVQGEQIAIDGVRLEVCRWGGTGVPILLLHEGLGSISMWRDFPERLAAATRRPVVAWSRRAHGRSDRLDRQRDPDYMHREADALPLVMEALAIPRAVLLGHSDGGSIALIAGARYPDRVAALILEAPHVLVEALTVASIAAVRRTYETTDLRRKLGRHHDDADHVFWHWNDIWLDPRFRDWNIEALLPAIRAPTFLIQGQDDEYGTMDQLDRIDRVLPITRRLELERCGHAPHRDRIEAVLEAISAFLEECVA